MISFICVLNFYSFSIQKKNNDQIIENSENEKKKKKITPKANAEVSLHTVS